MNTSNAMVLSSPTHSPRWESPNHADGEPSATPEFQQQQQQQQRPHPQQQQESNEQLVDKINAPYKKYMNRVAEDNVPEEHSSATNKAMFQALSQKRLAEKEKTDTALATDIECMVDKQGAAKSAMLLAQQLESSNSFAAVKKSFEKAHRAAFQKQNSIVARAATALLGDPCAIEDCPHLGRKEYFGLCAERHWKAINRIPDNVPHRIREKIKEDRKRTRQHAILSRRSAKMARMMNIIDEQQQQQE